MDTIQEYQQQSQQAVDAKVINSGVAKDREDRILKRSGHNTNSMDGIVMNMYQQKAELEKLTYMDEGIVTQVYMKACYKVGLKEPLKELDKKRQEILADVQVLEFEQNKYTGQIDNLDTKIKEVSTWVFDADKTLREREDTKETLDAELSYEQQEVQNCRESYKNAASKEEKGNLLEMVRGYEASKQEKENKIRQLDDEISKASQSFNEFYDEQEMLKEAKNNLLYVKQAVTDMQADLVFLGRQFGNIVQEGGYGPLATAELLSALQHKMGRYVNMGKKLKEIADEQFVAIRTMGDAGKKIKKEFQNTKKTKGMIVSKNKEDDVQRAKERRENLYAC